LRSSPRLLLLALLPALVALAIAAAVLWTLLPARFEESAGAPLLETARLLSTSAAELPEGSPEELQSRATRLRGGSGLRVTLIAPDGRVLADSALRFEDLAGVENHGSRPEVRAALAAGGGVDVRRSATTGDSFVYAATTYTDARGELRVLRLAEPLRQLAGARREILASVGVAAAAAAAVLLVLFTWVNRRLFVPLGEIVDGAGRLASGAYDQRLALPREGALAALAAALNRLGEQVETQVARLAAERDHLRIILASMAEGILVADRRGRAQLVNPAFARLFGLRGENHGRTVVELTRLPRVADAVERALREGETPAETVALGDPPRTVAVAAARLPAAQGVVLVARDVTDQARLAEIRRDFVANVSHELKTPLAAVRGYAETLADGALEDPEVAHRFLDRILEQCARLEALLDDLLTLSRIETVERGAERRPVALQDLVAPVLEAVSPAAASRDVRLTVEGELGREVTGDPEELRRMLSNLIENAVKYNRRGGQVELRVVPTAGALVIEVRDTGIGIPAEALPRIFERFYRVDRGRAREEGGTGLGLAIVKHVAQAHGGRVEVESEPGRGSTFRVVLPDEAG
jgi:two-component system phosphate regulon sensor histidine kinase PhoR